MNVKPYNNFSDYGIVEDFYGIANKKGNDWCYLFTPVEYNEARQEHMEDHQRLFIQKPPSAASGVDTIACPQNWFIA